MKIRSPEIARRLVDAYIISVRQRLSTQHLRQLSTLPGANEEQERRLCAAYPGVPPELVYFLRRVNGTQWRTPVMATEATAGVTNPTSSPEKTTPRNRPLHAEASSASKTPSAAAPSVTASSLAASFLKATLTGADSKPINPHHITVPILGSALGNCPYYLFSVESILHHPRFPLPCGALPGRSDLSNACDTNTGLAGESSRIDRPPVDASVGLKEPQSIFELYSGKAEIVRAVPPNLAKTTKRGDTMNPLKKLGRRRSERGGSVVEKLMPDTHTQQQGLPAATVDSSPEVPSRPVEATAPDGAASLTRVSAPCESVSSAPPTLPAAGCLPKVYVDPRVDIHADLGRWLPFADSMHGSQQGPPPSGSAKSHDAAATTAPTDRKPEKPSITVSRLFVDFEPEWGQGGTIGQIVQYSRDPQESFVVIADDFGSYLKFLMGEELEFTGELDSDEEEVEAAAEPGLTTEGGKVM